VKIMETRAWRVLHLGNTNNIGFLNAKFMRAVGIQADLLTDQTDHITYQPLWSEPEGEPLWARYYSSKIRHCFCLGRWRIPFPFAHRFHQIVDIVRQGRDYDILQAYNYDIILCLAQSKRLVVAYCVGGDLNISALSRNWVGRLLRIAYQKADIILYSNIDMVSAVNALGLKHARYIPLPVDTEKFRSPSQQEYKDLQTKLMPGVDFVCFSPTRHDWEVKGSDSLIAAWADIVRWARGWGGSLCLVMCEWGKDLKRSQLLVKELGLEEWVCWVPLMDKMSLRDWYMIADVVADQFRLKAFGLVALEAMACGKPVVASVDREMAESFYSKPPPIFTARTADEIAEVVQTLAENTFLRRSVGEQSRRWIEEHHAPQVIVREHMAVYSSLLSGRRG